MPLGRTGKAAIRADPLAPWRGTPCRPWAFFDWVAQTPGIHTCPLSGRRSGRRPGTRFGAKLVHVCLCVDDFLPTCVVSNHQKAHLATSLAAVASIGFCGCCSFEEFELHGFPLACWFHLCLFLQPVFQSFLYTVKNCASLFWPRVKLTKDHDLSRWFSSGNEG